MMQWKADGNTFLQSLEKIIPIYTYYSLGHYQMNIIYICWVQIEYPFSAGNKKANAE